MYRYRQLILGILLGAWVGFFLLGYMISQEFNPVWTNLPNGYKQLHDEIKDALFLFPIIILLPATIFMAGLLYANKYFEIKAKSKKLNKEPV